MTYSNLKDWRDAGAPLSERFLDEQEAQGRPARALGSDMVELGSVYENMTDVELMNHVRRHPVQGIIDL